MYAPCLPECATGLFNIKCRELSRTLAFFPEAFFRAFRLVRRRAGGRTEQSAYGFNEKAADAFTASAASIVFLRPPSLPAVFPFRPGLLLRAGEPPDQLGLIHAAVQHAEVASGDLWNHPGEKKQNLGLTGKRKPLKRLPQGWWSDCLKTQGKLYRKREIWYNRRGRSE